MLPIALLSVAVLFAFTTVLPSEAGRWVAPAGLLVVAAGLALMIWSRRRTDAADQDASKPGPIGSGDEIYLGMLEALTASERQTAEANAELVKANEKLQEANLVASRATEAARQANAAKSKFLAAMSHELRTPLNAIIGYSEMLIDDSEDLGLGQSVADLQRICSAGKHLLSLINGVLDLAKIEADRMDVHVEDFDVGQMLDDVVATTMPLALKGGNELEKSWPDDLGRMRSDPTKVRQCLINLLGNAFKFTERGRVTLSAVRERTEGMDFVELAVSDTGIGMTAEQEAKVFEPFTQAEAGTTLKYGGTGLGLAITRSFARLLGGEISVQSELGKGTTFRLRLPAMIQSETEAPAARQSDENAAKGSNQSPATSM